MPVSTNFVDERAAGGDARHRGAERRRLIRPHGQQEKCAAGRPGELCRNVRTRVTRRKVPGQHEGDRHRRVDVRTREVTGRVDHDHDHEAEHDRHAEHAEGTVVAGIGHDRATAREDEDERRQPLGGGATGEARPARRRLGAPDGAPA
jgi:hypothetical protein